MTGRTSSGTSGARRRGGLVGATLQNPGDAVYGVIAVGALLAAEVPQQETYSTTFAGVVITMVVYWLAHSYAALVGDRVTSARRLTSALVMRTMLQESPILVGAAFPVIALIICWCVGAPLQTTVNAAVWTSAAIVMAIEFAAAARARLRGRQLLIQSAAGVVFGLLIIALKLVLH